MNLRFVFQQLGLLLIVLSVTLVGIGLWALLPLGLGDGSRYSGATSMFVAALVGCVSGSVLYFGAKRNGAGSTFFGRREALLLVAMSWMVGAALSALPLFFWAWEFGDDAGNTTFRSFVNCYFEAMSGLTTTGATVLTNIENLPRSILLWRATTHWLGGIGIVVLFVAVLPSLGVSGKKLFRVEAPGPQPEGVTPHIRDTSRILWYIYIGFTVVEVALLWALTPMGLFDAVCHTFGTLATGGFSTRNASVGGYDSMTADLIIIVFMVLAGANFGLYYQLFRGKFRSVWRDTELRAYLIIIGIAAVIVSGALWSAGVPIVTTAGTAVEPTLAESLRYGTFTTISIQTTTGFCTADFNVWPFIAQATIIALMFIGGCAGSTGGGIKVVRIWIVLKIFFGEIERVFRPSVVRATRLGNTTVDDALKLATVAYVLGIVLLFASGAVVLKMFDPGQSFTTCATASITTLCNVGPGLDNVGAIENYHKFSWESKLVLTLLMALGRLEVFAIIVLFSPRFWRRH
ncbi:MAG: TrkH family potassium uptake protein [Phycisphaerales bacterium]|nr:TrkH family potassium uptake protein [Phycisphaerales bacterium]